MQSLSNKIGLLDDGRFHKKSTAKMTILYKFTKYVYFLRNICVFFIALEKVADEIYNFDSDFDN